MWCNPGVERTFAVSRADFVGRPIRGIFTDEDRAAGLDDLEMAVADADAIAEDDRWHVRADGSRFWSSDALLSIKDEKSGELLGFGKMLRDRTDLETHLELLQNQREQALQGDREKDRAITKLSHELRNVIAGFRAAGGEQGNRSRQRVHRATAACRDERLRGEIAGRYCLACSAFFTRRVAMTETYVFTRASASSREHSDS
jgi:hypothetical protein